jgi:hypothetical protein
MGVRSPSGDPPSPSPCLLERPLRGRSGRSPEVHWSGLKSSPRVDVPCSQSDHTYAYRRPCAGLSPFSVTVTLSRGATATTEKVAPGGFPHLMQPQQARLWATWPLPLTGRSVRLQTRMPPAGCAGNHCSASAASHRFSPLGIRRGAITPGFRRFTIIPRVIGAAPGGYVIPMAITYFALATGKNASTATFAARNTRNLHF